MRIGTCGTRSLSVNPMNTDDPSVNPGDPLLVENYWQGLEHLLTENRIMIDRPHGSIHPRWLDFVYPLDYGYLEGTASGDGDGIDVWLGSGDRQNLAGLLVTVDAQKRDVEVKLLAGCTREEMQTAFNASISPGMQALLIERDRFGLGSIRSRHSVRTFRPDPIPKELLNRILEAATWAPSAHHRQPWRFAVVTDSGAKNRLAEKMGARFQRDLRKMRKSTSGMKENAAHVHCLSEAQINERVERSRQRISQAPVVVVLCLDSTCVESFPDAYIQQAEILMAQQGVTLAGGSLLLAAHMAGLAGVWMCAPLFATEEVEEVLHLPGEWQPLGMILLGFAAGEERIRPRQSLEEVSLFFEVSE
jgi:F420 biosynthesis protein FbiB-like protein